MNGFMCWVNLQHFGWMWHLKLGYESRSQCRLSRWKNMLMNGLAHFERKMKWVKIYINMLITKLSQGQGKSAVIKKERVQI